MFPVECLIESRIHLLLYMRNVFLDCTVSGNPVGSKISEKRSIPDSKALQTGGNKGGFGGSDSDENAEVASASQSREDVKWIRDRMKGPGRSVCPHPGSG